jgi:hypothetical protein
MAVFKAFKPEAMNKIAKAMGYSGDMGQFQSYIEQDPMRQQQMQRYTNAAMQMARGGVVHKMRTGGFLSEGPEFYTPQQGETLLRNTPTPTAPYTAVMPATGGQFAFKSDGTRVTVPQGYFDKPKKGGGQYSPQNAPGYQDFLQSDIYKQRVMGGGDGLLGVAAPAVLDPVQVDGQTYNFANPVIGGAYREYMANRGQDTGVGKSNYPQPQPPEGPIGGGFLTAAQQQQTTPPPAAQTEAPPTINQASMQRMYQPGLPVGGVVQAAPTVSEAGQYVQPQVGTVTGAVAVPTAMAGVAQATPTQESAAAQMEAAQAAPAVASAVQATQAAQATVDPRAQVTAAQQTASSVGNLTAAQGNAILIEKALVLLQMHRLLLTLQNKYKLQRPHHLHKLLYKVSLHSLQQTLIRKILLHGLLAHFAMRQRRWQHVGLVQAALLVRPSCKPRLNLHCRLHRLMPLL